MDRFAIIANPRTGSTALANFFRDLHVKIYYEPFRQDKIFVEKVANVIEDALRLAYYQYGFDGMKHITSHLTFETNHRVCYWLESNKINTVFLRRRNLALATISAIIASRTGVWEIQYGDTGGDQLKYNEITLAPIGIDFIHSEIDKQHEVDSYLDMYGFQVIYYEDLFGVPEVETYQQIAYICKLLGMHEYESLEDVVFKLADTHFSPGTKQTKPHILERIPNWKEIKEEFHLD